MSQITIPRDDPAFLARFWAKVDKSAGPDSCWLWTAFRNQKGYGQFLKTNAHRVSWMIANGAIQVSLFVLHRCDNPPCVNPAHLWLGTAADNTADMIAKGRQASSKTHPGRWKSGDQHYSRLRPDCMPRGEHHGSKTHPERMPRGEAHGGSKLTEVQVRDIRAASGTTTDIASRFVVSRSIVGRIRNRKLWKHVA